MKKIVYMKKALFVLSFLLIFLLTGITSYSQESAFQREDLSFYFTGFNGCFLLKNELENKITVFNEREIGRRVSPCSTFKIVNALIGLETGVLQDENTVFEWDGTQYEYAIWNQNQTLASAVKYSVIWYFQEVARRIGKPRMETYLAKLQYGNQDISGGIDHFWLSSTLQISPLEQFELIQQLNHETLPMSKRNMEIVKTVLQINENGVQLSGKTGSAADNRLGWFVGYLERKQGNLYFVTKIEGLKDAYGGKAKEITLKILKDKGYLL